MTEIKFMNGSFIKCIETDAETKRGTDIFQNWQMRSYTEDEIEAHEEMLERLSIDTGVNICEGREDNE